MSMVEYAQETRWEIADDQGAEWAVQKMMDAQADTEKWKAHFDAQLAGIKRQNDETIARMEAYLEDYFDRVPHKTSKTQESYALPSAKLIRKAQQPLYKRDDDQLLQWLADNAPDLVRAKWEPNWAELKKRFTAIGGQAVIPDTGEIIPGITVEERGAKFVVAVTGKGEDDD